jgi:hypothetical protein
MSTVMETREPQVAWELGRRPRMGVFATAGGLLLLVGNLLPVTALRGVPNVGVVQGLTPLLNGQAKPAVSPRYQFIAFLDHHAATLIIGAALEAVGLALLAIALHFVFGCVRFRRPETMAAAGPLVLYAAPAVGVLTLAGQIVQAVLAHRYLNGHDHGITQADYVLVKAPIRVAIGYLSLLAELGLLVGLFTLSLNAMRTGLLTRGLGGVGMVVAAVLLLAPALGVLADVIPPLWALALGLLLLGRWPSGDPPAWARGEAVPWPSGVEQRAARAAAAQERRGGGGRRGRPAPAAQPAPAPAPVPTPARASGSRGKRRKRRGGGTHRG